MPRRKLDPYHCPRCGYEVQKKSSMVFHFTHLKKPCPALENDIQLTEAITEHVLANRIYKILKQDNKRTTIINYNQTNNINNIIAGMDAVEKLEQFMQFKGKSLIDFETTVEESFKKTVHQLDTDAFRSNYFLSEDNLLDMVGKVSRPSQNPNDNSHDQNVIYDKKLKELKIYDGNWESMSLDAGSKHYIERIQKNYFDKYERYLLRNIHNLHQGISRTTFREMLEQYYSFISCFDLDPYCKDATDDEIMRPVSSDDDRDSDSDDDSDSASDTTDDFIRRERAYQRSQVRGISEEFYPIFKKISKDLSKTYRNGMVHKVQDVIKRNSLKNIIALDRKITKLFHMDETFRDYLFK